MDGVASPAPSAMILRHVLCDVRACPGGSLRESAARTRSSPHALLFSPSGLAFSHPSFSHRACGGHLPSDPRVPKSLLSVGLLLEGPKLVTCL